MSESDTTRPRETSSGVGFDLAYYEKRRSDCVARAASAVDPAVASRYREFAQLYTQLIDGATPSFMSSKPR
jgi:hypothetical protein